MSKSQSPPKFEDVKHPEYKTFFATGVFGGITPDDAKMIFSIDHLEIETDNEGEPGLQKLKKIVREYLVEVHMTPNEWKTIANWMSDHVKSYEEEYGPIPMAPKGKGPPENMVS